MVLMPDKRWLTNYFWLFITFLTTLLSQCIAKQSALAHLKNKTKSDSTPVQNRLVIRTLHGSWVQNGRRGGLGAENDDEKPDPERGPIRDAWYNPSYGYEPYWYEGDWVFDPITTKKPSLLRPNSKVSNCGLKCGIVYENYGPICGRTRNFKYKSFRNLCAMKSEDCEGIHEWKALYEGECRFATILHRTSIKQRANEFIQRLFTEYPATFAHVGKYLGLPIPMTMATQPPS